MISLFRNAFLLIVIVSLNANIISRTAIAATTIPDDISSSLTQWSSAWAAHDIEKYLAQYDETFEPNGKATREQWEKQRRQRLTKHHGITIDLEHPQIRQISGDVVEVQFVQKFRSQTYKDTSLKTLTLIHREDGWKITREISVPFDGTVAPTGSETKPPILATPIPVPLPSEPVPISNQTSGEPGIDTANPPVPVAPPKKPSNDSHNQIRNAIDRWVTAWTRQETADYLATYDEEFEPAKGISRSQWEQQRRHRLKTQKQVSIDIENLSIRLIGNNTAEAVFVQRFQSKTFRDVTLKTLTLMSRGDTWKIRSETSEAFTGTFPKQDEIEIVLPTATTDVVPADPTPSTTDSTTNLVTQTVEPQSSTPEEEAITREGVAQNPLPHPENPVENNLIGMTPPDLTRNAPPGLRLPTTDVETTLIAPPIPTPSDTDTEEVPEQPQSEGTEVTTPTGKTLEEPENTNEDVDDLIILHIQSTPSGAKVYNAQGLIGTTPFNWAINRAEKTADLKFSKDGFKDYPLSLNLTPDVQAPLVRLQPSYGSARINSTPPGAELWVDDMWVGTTPWHNLRLSTGSHRISLRFPMFKPLENVVIEVSEGKQTQQTFALTPNYAELIINIPDGEVGIRSSNDPAKQSAPLPVSIPLEEGAHVITVKRRGFAPQEMEVNIIAGEDLRIEESQFQWRALQGSITVTTNPEIDGADVYLNGKLVGLTPYEATLPTGTINVRIVSEQQEAEADIEIIDETETQAALTLDWKTGTVFRDCAECPEMVVLPAGTFTMGSLSGDASEQPLREVTISHRFAIGKYEITRSEWLALTSGLHVEASCPNCAASNISAIEANEFINLLKKNTGKRYRLPSEAEWEYACKANQTTTYCGGDDADAVAWFNMNSAATAHPVGEKLANAFGLFDMSGNLWEWTDDCWNKDYSDAPVDGSPRQTGNCELKALRGGSWFNGIHGLRPSLRFRFSAASRDNITGFRVVRELSSGQMSKN